MEENISSDNKHIFSLLIALQKNLCSHLRLLKMYTVSIRYLFIV